jgi:hypothetical protein
MMLECSSARYRIGSVRSWPWSRLVTTTPRSPPRVYRTAGIEIFDHPGGCVPPAAWCRSTAVLATYSWRGPLRRAAGAVAQAGGRRLCGIGAALQAGWDRRRAIRSCGAWVAFSGDAGKASAWRTSPHSRARSAIHTRSSTPTPGARPPPVGGDIDAMMDCGHLPSAVQLRRAGLRSVSQ